MSGLFTIPLTGLKEGSHIYDFDVTREFFEKFEESEIKDSELKVVASLLKRSAHMELELELEGRVLIMCDRCLGDYWQDIESSFHMLLKFGENWEEINDELIMIPADESNLDISQFIYEFAHLSLPMQRLHYESENGKSECDPLMIEKLEKHINDKEESIDPRWKELGKLKDGLKN